MDRKRLTQRFPFLLPMRRAQRKMCFYAGMRFDGCRYAQTIGEKSLSHLLFETDCALYNHNTGFDMIYQENKVFNLKLAAKTLNGLLIRPGETFSFWWLVRHADKDTPYKDGLTVTNGKLTTMSGGGMCQMSNLLFWMFLHTPLTIIQRRGHEVYVRESGGIYEYAQVKRMQVALGTGEIIDCKLLYTNKCKICYPLPESVDIQEENQ